jgi:hypothetical protein
MRFPQGYRRWRGSSEVPLVRRTSRLAPLRATKNNYTNRPTGGREPSPLTQAHRQQPRNQNTLMDMGHCKQQACPSPHSTSQRRCCQSFWQGYPGLGTSHPYSHPVHFQHLQMDEGRKEENQRNTTGRSTNTLPG